jgi:hypothetical protein
MRPISREDEQVQNKGALISVLLAIAGGGMALATEVAPQVIPGYERWLFWGGIIIAIVGIVGALTFSRSPPVQPAARPGLINQASPHAPTIRVGTAKKVTLSRNKHGQGGLYEGKSVDDFTADDNELR